MNRPGRSCAGRSARGLPPTAPSISDMVGPSPPGWQAHVGSRVVLRLRTGTGGFRDVLGELLSADEGRLRALTRRGEEVVDAAAVVAGKPVPPPPTRAARPHLALSTLALETVMAAHWRGAPPA